MNIGSSVKSLITPNELSKLFSISKSSVYRLVDNRSLPFYKIGGNLRFSLNDVDNYLSDVKVEPIEKQYEYIQKK
ncbi:MAG: helix-turn-helix domain-containing protein [Bacteroidales bacterium]|nr:helix-turn-helix domain-containing protein [Bacteroidales bacterium]